MITLIKKLALFLLTIILFTGCDNKSSSNQENTPENGDLNNTFVEKSPTVEVELTPEQKYLKAKEKLISEGWEERNIKNGQLSSCYNFKPKKGDVDNSLEVFVGSGTDVSIKIMNSNTNKCVRYVFINSGSTYSINNRLVVY